MHSEPLYNLSIWSSFQHIEVNGETSGPAAFISFRDKNTGLDFPEAVLLPQDLRVQPEFNSNSYVYPIFFPDSTVEVVVHWEMDQTRSRRSIYAIITCTSKEGERIVVMHYLCAF